MEPEELPRQECIFCKSFHHQRQNCPYRGKVWCRERGDCRRRGCGFYHPDQEAPHYMDSEMQPLVNTKGQTPVLVHFYCYVCEELAIRGQQVDKIFKNCL